jgi:hypothetical protein
MVDNRGPRRGERVRVGLIGLLSALAACTVPTNSGSPAPGELTTTPALTTTQSLPSDEGGTGSGGAASPTTSPSPASTTAGSGDEPLGEFLAACEQKSDAWRSGRVTYPSELEIPLDEGRTYQARIDIRTGAGEETVPSGSAAAEVAVQCGVAARLVPLSSDVTVDFTEWSLQVFDEPGTVEWDWTVTAAAAHDTQVRLEFRPAVKAQDGSIVVPAADTSRAVSAAYTSAVHVQAKALEHVYYWWDHNWTKLAGIVAAIGAAAAAVWFWFMARRKEWIAARPKTPARTTRSRPKKRK